MHDSFDKRNIFVCEQAATNPKWWLPRTHGVRYPSHFFDPDKLCTLLFVTRMRRFMLQRRKSYGMVTSMQRVYSGAGNFHRYLCNAREEPQGR
jgi:hypothetical protein